MSPDVPSASMINSNLFAAMLLFCGILQPREKMPAFWRRLMYNVSPFTYVVQALVTPLVHNKRSFVILMNTTSWTHQAEKLVVSFYLPIWTIIPVIW